MIEAALRMRAAVQAAHKLAADVISRSQAGMKGRPVKQRSVTAIADPGLAQPIPKAANEVESKFHIRCYRTEMVKMR